MGRASTPWSIPRAISGASGPIVREAADAQRASVALRRAVFGGDDAARVAEDAGSLLESRGGGLPAALESRVEQLARHWLVRPDGDRRHRAVSGRVVDEKERVVELDDDVVRVLVLSHD